MRDPWYRKVTLVRGAFASRDFLQGISGWKWYCWRSDESPATDASPLVFPYPANYAGYPTVRTGCFGGGPGRLNFSEGRLCFAGDNLETEKTYVFKVIGEKNSRTGEGEIEIAAKNGDPPKITIR